MPVVAWLDGLVPLRAQPHAQILVAGYAYRGDMVRVKARYAGAWLRVRLVNRASDRRTFWLPDGENLCPYCNDRSLLRWG